MHFQHVLLKVNEANAFIVGCEETREALLVDAGDLDFTIPTYLEGLGLTLAKVFITHDHYDHTDGLPRIVSRYEPEVYAYKDTVAGVHTKRVREGDTVEVGRLTGRVLETPGHTPDGLSLAFPGMAFTGDALFAGSVGGTSSPELYRLQIDLIRRKIFSLPPETELHVGHGPSSTVGIESRYNPFFT
jgi:hydroxyacylglutathione hydrolase